VVLEGLEGLEAGGTGNRLMRKLGLVAFLAVDLAVSILRLVCERVSIDLDGVDRPLWELWNVAEDGN
jgi:hypothetical protein